MAYDVLSRVAKWHVMFCPMWQSGMGCFVQGGKVTCDFLSMVAKLHGCFVKGGKGACDFLSRMAKLHVMFCQGWQSGM